MTKIVQFNEAEVAGPADFTAIGEYARASDQAITGGAIGYPHHHGRFTITQDNGAQLTVTGGLFFKDDKIYSADDPIVVNIQTYLPLVAGDEKWIGLLVRGEAEVATASRLVETDVDTEETVLQAVPKIDRLYITITVQDSIPAPPPISYPSIGADQCCLAFVRLTTAGIAEIQPGETWRIKTLHEVEGRTTVLEGLMTVTRQRVSTLETDLSALAERMKLFPRMEIVHQLQRDVAATRRRLSLPDEARGYWYDAGLVKEQWDLAHVNWLARVQEGIRFGYAAERDAEIELLNSSNPDVIVTAADGFCMPAWTEEARIAVEADAPDGFKNISQQVHTVTDAIQHTVSRTSVSYGPTVAVCENQQEWSTVGGHREGETFSHNGETFRSVGLITNPNAAVDTSVINTWNPTATVSDIAAWNANPDSAGHQNYGVQQVEYHSYSYTYWEYVVTEFSVNGSVYAQSFLCASPMIVTSVDLYFTRIGEQTGDVHLSLCELKPTGEPNFGAVLSHTTLTQAELATGWVNFPLRPTLLTQGKRYAWFTVTTGNHALGFVGNTNPDNAKANQYAQGTMFWSTDGAWAQGQPGEDFMFRVNAAKFAQSRTVVEFQPLTLENGMTEMRLLYPGWVPAGTQFVWEIKPSESDEWTMLVPKEVNPLNGLPALVRLRATFIGTSDLMPMIVLSDKARSLTSRYRSSMVAIAKEATFGFATDTVQIETVVDNFYADHHTVTNKVQVGSTTYDADATTVKVDFTKPQRRTVLSTFTIPSDSTGARPRVEMTTDAVTLVPFVQNISMYAI